MKVFSFFGLHSFNLLETLEIWEMYSVRMEGGVVDEKEIDVDVS